LLGSGVVAAGDPHQRANSITTSNHTFTAVPGELSCAEGDQAKPYPYCMVAPSQNVTLASAEMICAALDACIGFTFRSPTATPAGVVESVTFSGVSDDCGYSRFGSGICPYARDGTFHTYLKDYKPVPRNAVWLRHYNLSVVPPRCGDINIEPLFPYDIPDVFIFRYAQVTVEEFSSFALEHGECGKVGPYGNPGALSYTQRSNPASMATPWLGPGGGAGGGPGDPGYPGTGGSFQSLCESECVCNTQNETVHDPGCPTLGCVPCSDTNCFGRCAVCSPSFNKKLASNSTLIRLWCDPTDPGCKSGNRSRPPRSVRVLADFAPGSPTNVKWIDHNSFPPTSNLTIVQGGDSYAQFSGTVYANTGFTRIATVVPAFKKIDLSEYVQGGAIVVEAKYPEAHHCYLDPGGGGSLCHFEGFKLALTSLKAPHHHGGHELFGMYKADLGKAKSTTLGAGWATLRLPLTAFSSDWSDFTGECNTKDPDGYQHKCCDASSGTPWEEPCPTTDGLASIIGLSIWSEGVLGDFSLDIKSISIEL